MPFRVVGSGPEADLMRDGMVDLLYIHLDGFAGLRLVNPTTIIAQTRAHSAGDLRNTAGLARQMGAGTFIIGTAIHLGAEMRLLGEVYDATTLERKASVQLQGNPSRLGLLVDSLAWSLARYRLAQHPAAVPRSLEEYTTRSLASLRAYLAGEQLARSSQWGPAMDSLKRATALDSLFGLAWYAQYRVALWGGQGNEIEQEVLIQNGLRSNQLGPRQRDLLLAIDALQQGTRAEALARERVLAERYPQDPDAALARGEILYHIGLSAGIPPRQALAAFQTMIAIDPRAVEGYGHAVELLCLVGDPEQALKLLREAPVSRTGRGFLLGVELAVRAGFRGESPDALLNGPDSVTMRRGAPRASFEILRIFPHDPARALALADSFSTFMARKQGREPVSLGRYQLLLAQGQFRAAWRILSLLLERNPDDVPILANAATPVSLRGPDQAERREAAHRLLATGGWWSQIPIVWWAGLDGDTLGVDSAAAILRSFPGWPPVKFRESIGTGARGLALLAIGDTARARLALGTALETRYYQMGVAWSTVMPTVPFALQLAKLDLAQGNLEQARRRLADALNRLDEEFPYSAEAHELLGQIAERQGDTAGARRAYQNFIALWEHADPELQPRVAAARDSLRKLGG